MKNNFLKKFGVYIAAIVVFAIFACVYCAPSLKGMVVSAGDTSGYKGMVHETESYHEATGDYTFWTGSMFCGMPTYQIGGSQYKSSVLLKPFKKILLSGHSAERTPCILLLYLVCFFILLRCFDVDGWTSIAGATAMALSSYFLVIIPAGHITKTSTIALMAVVIGGFKLTFSKRYGAGFALTAIPVAVAFTNHPQMSYYMCLLIGVMFIAELFIHIKEKRYKDFAISTLIFGLSMGLALGANCANVFANSEYASQTMRGGHSDLYHSNDADNKTSGLDLDYATQWSYGIGESLSFMIPGVRGGSSSADIGKGNLYNKMVSNGIDRSTSAQFCSNIPLYWGNQPGTSGNVYMGAVVCFLFVLGLIIVKGPYKWALAAATLLSVMLAWGHNFMPLTEFFFKYFPLYNKFRTVSSILIVAEITMPLLGFMALKEIMSGNADRRETTHSVYVAAGITAGVCLILAIFGKALFSFTGISDASLSAQLPDFIYNGIIAERQALLTSDSLRSAMFIAGSAIAVLLFIYGHLKTGILTAVIGILVLADMWPIDRRYFNEDNYVTAKQNSRQFEMLPYEKRILADTDPHFRVLNLTTNTFNESRTSYYLKSLGGYHAAKLRRYQDMIEQHIAPMHMNVISMLNAKYVITAGNDGEPVPYLNPDAMGNAWFVDTLLVVDNADQECEALNNIDLHTTAVLDRQFADFAAVSSHRHDSTATVTLTEYTPKRLEYTSSSEFDGTVVFSEIYYPFGWKATIDGKQADHFRVNYTLRALNVPAGEHEICFVFAPDSIRKGDAVSVACVSIIYIVLLGTIIMTIIRRRRPDGN